MHAFSNMGTGKGVVQLSLAPTTGNSNTRIICIHDSEAIFSGQAVVIGAMNIAKYFLEDIFQNLPGK